MNKILTKNALEYTLGHLFFVSLSKQFNYDYIISDNKLVVNFENYNIIFYLIDDKRIDILFSGDLEFQYIYSYNSEYKIPVILDNPKLDFAIIENHNLIINANIITLSFILLSRYEELIIDKRDKHNRFEYQNSLSYKYDFVDIPIVDEYALLLRFFFSKLISNLTINKQIGKIIPSHDIDSILRFGGLLNNIKTIVGGDIFKRRSISLALRSLRDCVNTKKCRINDPYIRGIEDLINISKKYSLRSEFYFMGLKKGDYDCRYDIFIPEVQYCLSLIEKDEMCVGIHGGYFSYDNHEILKKEINNFNSVLGKTICIGRQHYLRFDINKSINIWEECGICRDSSLGFAEHEGFRCGTCHDYYLFDLKNDRISTVMERPLIIMEQTLFTYQNYTVSEAYDSMIKLYKRCMSAEGNFVILWHNTSTDRDFRELFKKVYCRFIENVCE